MSVVVTESGNGTAELTAEERHIANTIRRVVEMNGDILVISNDDLDRYILSAVKDSQVIDLVGRLKQLQQEADNRGAGADSEAVELAAQIKQLKAALGKKGAKHPQVKALVAQMKQQQGKVGRRLQVKIQILELVEAWVWHDKGYTLDALMGTLPVKPHLGTILPKNIRFRRSDLPGRPDAETRRLWRDIYTGRK